MKAIVSFAVRRWQFSLLAAALLIGLGLNAFQTLPRTEDPQLSFPGYIITVVLPGATPEDIEQQVTKPIEDALSELDNLREIKSTSADGVARISPEFIWGSNAERKYDEVVREVNALRASLPTGIARLEIRRIRPSAVPFVQIALTSDILPARSFEKLARDLRDRLARVPGVRKSEVLGAPQDELRVSLDTDRLAALGLTGGDVVAALRAGGMETPLGTVNAGARRFNVRNAGAYSDATAVRAIPVRSAAGQTVRVGDVASVAWASREASHIVRFNGKRALMVTAERADGQDVTALTRLVDKEIDQFRTTLPGSVTLERGLVQADNVRHRLGLLTRDFLLAVAIVSLTLLPLGLRAASVVMLAIPASLLFGVMALAVSGLGLNQIAVAGFVLALGLLVDDAIVVVENIARWLREGADRMTAAIEGTAQIALAVIGCTACLMFAFLPLIALPEGAGEFIRSLPIAVLATVGGSLIISLTLIPFAASRLLSRNEDPHGNRLLRWLTGGIERLYGPALHAALARPWRALGGIYLLSTLAVPLMILIGSSLFPSAELPQFLVKVEMPRGTALAETDAMIRRVDARLRDEPGIAWTLASSGRGAPQLYYNSIPSPEDPAFGEVAASFDQWDPYSGPAILEKLRQEFNGYAGARINVVTFTQGAPVEAPIAIRIVGPDIATLTRLAAASQRTLEGITGLRDVGNPLQVGRTDVRLDVDNAQAEALGIPAGALRQAVQLALGGAQPAVVRDSDGDDYPLTVRLPMTERYEVAALDRIFVPSTSGTSVPLSTIAAPALTTGPAQIDRVQRERVVTISAFVEEGILVSQVTQTAIDRLRAEVPLPPGYAFQIAGEAETQARSFAGLLPAIVIATVGILAVLVLEFGTFRNVAVVAGIIPLGFFGAIAALWITGNSLSFTASIGLIALVGIEIKNSILLVDFTEQLRRQGATIREAVEKAGELRFLPVLLTSITAIGGLMPLAVEGNGLYSPMAIAMIGGLVTSTLLSRIATPVLYLLVSRNAGQTDHQPGIVPAGATA